VARRTRHSLKVKNAAFRRRKPFGVTANPTAEWIARQVSEACGWEPVPDYLVRDRDRVYGETFTRRIRAMGIRDRPIAPHHLGRTVTPND